MDVKTNKEYTAMLHEIEGVEREIRAREDQILAEMERAETLTAEVKREEEAFKAADEAATGRAAASTGRGGRSSSRRRRRASPAERDEVAPAHARRTLLDLFQRVAQLRGIGRGRGQGRDVLAVPPEAAAADVRGPEAQRRDRSSARSATASSTTSRPSPVVVPQQM